MIQKGPRDGRYHAVDEYNKYLGNVMMTFAGIVGHQLDLGKLSWGPCRIYSHQRSPCPKSLRRLTLCCLFLPTGMA